MPERKRKKQQNEKKKSNNKNKKSATTTRRKQTERLISTQLFVTSVFELFVVFQKPFHSRKSLILLDMWMCGVHVDVSLYSTCPQTLECKYTQNAHKFS